MNDIDQETRFQTQLQWNTTACGKVDGYDEGPLEYFDAVMTNQYKIQDWQHDYFKFETYAGKKSRLFSLRIGTGLGLLILIGHILVFLNFLYGSYFKRLLR